MKVFDLMKPGITPDSDILSFEWLDTNGLGGWASATLCGCNSRRYHGLLVADTNPPTERMILISKLDETIICGDKRFELGVNNYGDVIAPQGYLFLKSFSKELYPVFTFQTADVKLQKSILMIHGENTAIIEYVVQQAPQAFTLELLPLLAVRDIHELTHANSFIQNEASFAGNVFRAKLYDETPEIFIKLSSGNFHEAPDWYYNFNYEIEKYRGLEYVEDLYTPGKFHVEFKEGDSLFIILSTEDPAFKDAASLFNAEIQRRQSLIEPYGTNETLKQLVLAADQFIVKRSSSHYIEEGQEMDLKTIIAGYHWLPTGAGIP
jgi:predicted glycogen debranching enzyme